MRHVLLRHVNGDPYDIRLYDKLFDGGSWTVRRVQRDEHYLYVTLNGKRLYLDDPDLHLRYLD